MKWIYIWIYIYIHICVLSPPISCVSYHEMTVWLINVGMCVAGYAWYPFYWPRGAFMRDLPLVWHVLLLYGKLRCFTFSFFLLNIVVNKSNYRPIRYFTIFTKYFTLIIFSACVIRPITFRVMITSTWKLYCSIPVRWSFNSVRI